MDRTSYYTCVDSSSADANKAIRVCFTEMRLPTSLTGKTRIVSIPADVSMRQHPAYIQKTLGQQQITICIDGKTNIRVASTDG